MNEENCGRSGHSGHGVFAVELRMRNVPRVEAVLTGEHFSVDETGMAKAIAGRDGSALVANGGSPVYLVRDSVVKLALMSRRRALRSGMSECASGTCNEPCGDCEECRNAESDAFTRVILGAMELPSGDLSDRLRDAVSSVIGMVWADAPWESAMTDEEVEEVFNELGVKSKTERN